MTTFPVPFAGIKKMLVCETESQFHALTLALTSCHPHNIALEPEMLRIYVSEMGAECATTWYGQRDTPPPAPPRAARSR